MSGTNGWQTTEAGQALQQQLNDQHTLMAMTRILQKIEQLEESVNALAQAPAMVAMVTDMADEAVAGSAERGIDIEARLKAALEMAEKLTAPETMAKFDQLLALADQAPHMAAMVGDMADEAIGKAAARGVNVEQRLKAGVGVLEKLTEPKMMAQLEQLMTLGEQSPGLVAMVGDMADEAIAKMHANGIDINERVQIGLTAAERLTSPEIAQALPLLTDPDLINVLGMTGEALQEGMAMPERKVGIFGLLRELNDPDMQRGLSFLLNFGKAFGRKLKS